MVPAQLGIEPNTNQIPLGSQQTFILEANGGATIRAQRYCLNEFRTLKQSKGSYTKLIAHTHSLRASLIKPTPHNEQYSECGWKRVSLRMPYQAQCRGSVFSRPSSFNSPIMSTARGVLTLITQVEQIFVQPRAPPPSDIQFMPSAHIHHCA